VIPGAIRTTKKNILSDSEPREHAAALWHMSHAQLNDRLRREPIDRLAEETHRTGQWANQSGNGAECSTLPCPVRAEERYDFTLFYTQVKPLQGLDLAIGSNYILEFK
jgi:hypothetical protein